MSMTFGDSAKTLEQLTRIDEMPCVAVIGQQLLAKCPVPT
jgi:hypothetical protein